MAEQAHTAATVEIPSEGGAHGEHHGEPNLFNPQPVLVGFTWLTFLLMTAVLYKVAWKPILQALANREEKIRQSMENAEKTRLELAKIEETRKRAIDEADAKAKEILDTARKGALDAAAVIEAKARDEAQILLENAQREIRTAREQAVASLRKESADLAISLARKVLEDNLDETRGRALVDRMIRES